MDVNTIIVIPARYGASRLPGKVLADLGGMPVIERVWRAVCSVPGVDVLIATDEERVYRAASNFGANVVITSKDIKSGSDRVYVALNTLDKSYSFVINVQGDEPFISAEEILLLKNEIENGDSDIATLCVPISEKEAENPNNVKVVFDRDNNALYFSRSMVPYYRDDTKRVFYKHVGIYAYKRDALERFSALEESPLEKAERLEQLRALENGMKIKVLECEYNYPGIDTPEDLVMAEELLKRRGDA